MLRRLVTLAILALGGVASAVACGDDELGSSPATDGGSSSGQVAAAACPADAPGAGEACLLPEGTTCAFGACGTPIAACSRGTWRYGGNPAPRPPCPAEPPAADTPCPACWKTEDSCSYGSEDCAAADASTNRATATCPSGTWRISFFPCAETDAGDAGADVQGDAGADAD